MKAYAVQCLVLGCLLWSFVESLARSGREWTQSEVATDIQFWPVVINYI